jgi:hypothetical protein
VRITQDVPEIFTNTAPGVFTNDVPVIFSQDVPLSDRAKTDYPSGKTQNARRKYVRKKAEAYGNPRNDSAHPGEAE